MSAVLRANKVLRANYRGDPGLLSTIGKGLSFIGGLAPGPLGTLAKLAGTALAGNGKPVNPAIATEMGMHPILKLQQPGVPQIPQQTGLVNIVYPGTGLQLAPQGAGNQTQSGAGAGGFGGSVSTGAPCERGYHRNKTGYYSKRYGWIEEGSVCVKNRRRNPLNPRALSRSMARISSAKNAAAFLSRVTVRPRKGCGCS